uniref:Uncharacterized protein n=1 Tax=Arundo donax TaxID=35708 RepID=A0A0A8Y8N4_ARUDO
MTSLYVNCRLLDLIFQCKQLFELIHKCKKCIQILICKSGLQFTIKS